ncbi:hypothetical protein SKAU_G00225930 [Synaphobranchus kaupii]|uniref:Uncharacterized protein n=1 Tax=Synaphobranchus kaupii TaxID=118154 RepID=A0A9Q1FC67_SYNKA|nr:hypothetical protein SKAU_G00225930 [Synaphobranchus kaupii]
MDEKAPSPPSVTAKKPYGILAVGIGSAVGVVVLGVTAICLYKRYMKQKFKRQQAELINVHLYSSMKMEDILSASKMGGTDGIYTEINDLPSTFKSPPVPSQNDTYSLISAVPASSIPPLSEY